MKNKFTLLLILLTCLMQVSPCLSSELTNNSNQQSKLNASDDGENVFMTTIEDDKVYLVPKNVMTLEFESDFDINETPVNDKIYFRLVSKAQTSNGMYLPEHTRFVGTLKKISKSKPVFKRARAYIVIDTMILPNEKTYTLRMEPKNGSDLKAPQILNTIRAIPSGIGILTFSAISVATVAIESVTIVGLVVVPCTCRGFGVLISSMAKGLNYKTKAGSQIKFKLDTPVYVSTSDLSKI